MRVRWAGCVLMAALLCSACTSFDLQGHRGARGLAPENTLPAFTRALEFGVTTLELDVGVTRDGVVVVHHDPTLNPDTTRDADGRWLAQRGPAVHALSFDELSRYDVGRLKPGSKYGAPFTAQQGADGVRVPRLADLFALVRQRGDERVRFNIETKLSPLEPSQTLPPQAFARALIAEVRRAGMAGRTSIQSFDWRTLQVVQQEAPEIPTVYLSTARTLAPVDGKPTPWTAGIDPAAHGGSVPRMVRAAGGKVWSPSAGALTAAQVAEAHALGLNVVVWTVNDEATITRMLDLGVDGIISDRPDRVAQELQRRGMRWR
jgi:glycerophosphoryl diester phosphodiesterase